ncbi:MAG: NUDIX domain-containing protein [Clostridia bacterium]|nr:NUDIX domain-containing protein [Clostridia bacterium]
MFCTECGEKLTLMFANGEGLVPYCKNCGEYRFAQFSTAVSMVVTNRAKDKIMLARHKGHDDYILFAGYVKKGETAEKAVTREFKEETKLNVVKYKYYVFTLSRAEERSYARLSGYGGRRRTRYRRKGNRRSEMVYFRRSGKSN